MNFLIDTQEVRSAPYWNDYPLRHPRTPHTFTFTSLDIGDVAAGDWLIECKLGADLDQSLKTNHLQDQCRRMAVRRIECAAGGQTLKLVVACCDMPNSPITLQTYKWLVGVAFYAGVYMFHKNTLQEMIDHIVLMTATPHDVRDLSIPYKISGVPAGVVSALSYACPGVSMELAAWFVKDLHLNTIADCLKPNVDEWEMSALGYYGRNQKKLCGKLWRVLHGETGADE